MGSTSVSETPAAPSSMIESGRNQQTEKTRTMSLRDTLSMHWLSVQENLFPWLEEELGPLTEKQQQLVTLLEIVRLVEVFLRHWPTRAGQFHTEPPWRAPSLLRRFIKSRLKMLIDRLGSTDLVRPMRRGTSPNAIIAIKARSIS